MSIKSNYARINGNLYEEITPIKGLTIRAAQALEASDGRGTTKYIPNKENAFAAYWGVSENFSRYARFTATNTAEYKFSIKKDYNIIALIGQEAIVSDSKSFGASNTGTTDPRMNNINNGTNPKIPSYSYSNIAFNSCFARLSADYKSKYFLDASFRRDGSSLSGANKRYANFWSLGGMWNIKNESFMANANKYLSELKSARVIGYQPSNLSGQELIDEVRNERVRELLAEGFRFNDLKRWKTGFTRGAPQNPNIVSTLFSNLSISPDDYRFVWPLPQHEIDANPQIKNQQNQGY